MQQFDIYGSRNHNSKYDSRENCNAIIETATNTLIAGCQKTIIPNSVTSIGEHAFHGYSDMKITIPNSVTNIGGWAFYGCTNLTSVPIPNSVTSIGWAAFSGCSNLISMVVETTNSKYDSRENCNAIIETATNTLIAGCQKTIISNSVTSIGEGAFSGCSVLTSVTIPNSVTSIEYQAFESCTGLTSIEIPNSVTSIGYGAFAYCTGLTYVACAATNPPVLGDFVFYDVQCNKIPLYVPEKSIDSYKILNQWKDFKPISAIENMPSAIDQITNNKLPFSKVIHDGQIFIIRGEHVYDTQGKKIR